MKLNEIKNFVKKKHIIIIITKKKINRVGRFLEIDKMI